MPLSAQTYCGYFDIAALPVQTLIHLPDVPSSSVEYFSAHVYPSPVRNQLADQGQGSDRYLWLSHQTHVPKYAIRHHAVPESWPGYNPDQYGCLNSLQMAHQTGVMPVMDLSG